MSDDIRYPFPSGPCWLCGKTPKIGDIWFWERFGGVERQGHKECFEKPVVTDTRVGERKES